MTAYRITELECDRCGGLYRSTGPAHEVRTIAAIEGWLYNVGRHRRDYCAECRTDTTGPMGEGWRTCEGAGSMGTRVNLDRLRCPVCDWAGFQTSCGQVYPLPYHQRPTVPDQLPLFT